jgi:hypothetical protein
MINGVNHGEELISSQLKGQAGVNALTTDPIKNIHGNIDKNLLIDETAISNKAVNLYQKEQDVKQFNTLAMSNPEDLSHEEIISNLFNNGISDLLADNVISELSNNQNLLNDLSL